MDMLAMPHDTHSVDMESLREKMDEIRDGKMKMLVVLVHRPSCPYCQEYYPEYEEICKKIPEMCEGKGSAVTIESDEYDESLGETEGVPTVMIATPGEEGETKVRTLEGLERKVENLTKIVEAMLMEMAGKSPQEGKGFIESALAATILGGTLVGTHTSPMVQKYLKQATEGLVGLSKATADVAEGTVDMVSEQDLMKQLRKSTEKLLKPKRKKSRKIPKKSQKKTRKNKRKGKKN